MNKKYHNDANYDCPATALADTVPGKCICKPPHDESPFPVHERLIEVKEGSQAIGDFLTWCCEEGMWLAKYPKKHDALSHDTLRPVPNSITDLIAEFYEIDLKELENEKLEILDQVGKARDASTL